MADLRSLVLIQAAAADAAAETSDRTLKNEQIKETKSGGAGGVANPLPNAPLLAALLVLFAF